MAGPGSGRTELEDGSLVQVIDTIPIVRRSRTITGTGLYIGVLQNAHSVADDEQSSVDLYSNLAFRNGLTNPIPAGYDLWLSQISLQTGDAGDLTSAQLIVVNGADQVGMSINDTGAAFGGFAPRILLAQWDALTTHVNGAAQFFGIRTNGQTDPFTPNFRVRRGTSLEFSTTSSAAATFNCVFMFGVFPEGLGQDVGF